MGKRGTKRVLLAVRVFGVFVRRAQLALSVVDETARYLVRGRARVAP